MAIDLKYGRVELERSTIADDEPVVVFRARDAVLPELLSRYSDLCREAGSPPHHLAAIERSLDVVQDWQEAHEVEVQVPRSDQYGPQTGTFGTAGPVRSGSQVPAEGRPPGHPDELR